MATKAKRHAHKYHKVNLSIGQVWACALPDCSHYMPNHMTQLLVGKNTICWGCGEIMTLTPLNMQIDKPKCVECSIGPKQKENIEKYQETTTEELLRKFTEAGLITPSEKAS